MTTQETILLILAIGIFLVTVFQFLILLGMRVALVRVADLAEQLKSQVDPILTQTRETMASLKPLLDQTRETMTATKPLIEQTQTSLASVGPVLEQTKLILATTNDTTVLAKQAVVSLKAEAEACMAAVTTTTREIAKLTEEDVREVHLVVTDTTDRLRHQVERFDRLASRTALRIDDTAALVHRDVLKPINEISALLAGLKSFLEVLFAAERKQIDQAYQDEEMFI